EHLYIVVIGGLKKPPSRAARRKSRGICQTIVARISHLASEKIPLHVVRWQPVLPAVIVRHSLKRY
ncbi:hypothetical protein ACWM1N_18830, partial [Klebsiella grimontii]